MFMVYFQNIYNFLNQFMIHSLVSNEVNQLLLWLLESTHNWLQLLESGRDVGAIFFDFKKAFDSVPHHALMDKLKGINLNPLLLHWIQSYLPEGVNKSYWMGRNWTHYLYCEVFLWGQSLVLLVPDIYC